MNIGIGITTTPKRKHLLELCIRQIEKHSPFRYQLFVHDDTEGKGVAFSKNECLRALQNCEHIFLLDDDVVIKADGWEKIFTDSPIKHLMYLDNWGIIKQNSTLNFYYADDGREPRVLNFYSYNNCAGVLMYMKKEVVERIGAFNESFGRYGFEHVDYSLRIHKYFNTEHPFLSPVHASQCIHSLDYDGPFENIEAVPNLSVEEIQLAKAKAIQHFSENPEIYIPL